MRNGLSPEARAILDAARDGDEPTAVDRARVGRAMMVALGGSAAAASVSSSAAASMVAPGAASASATVSAASTAVAGGAVVAGSAGLLKVVVTLVVVGAAAGALAVQPWSEPETTPASTFVGAAPVATAPRAPIAPAVATPSVPQAAPIPQPAPQAAVPTATTPVRRRARPPAAPPRTMAALAERIESAETIREAPPSGLTEELQLLRAAHAARREGDTAGALRLLEEHATRFPRGVLAAERDGSRVLLVCARGRGVEAADAAAGFLATHPGSPLAPRIRARCGQGLGDPGVRPEP